jgi:prevent-host-death family protein
MPNIKPVSDLRNYTEVLNDCENGEPVFLTKNGRGKYVIMEIGEYEKQINIIKLLSKLEEAENAIETGNEWKNIDDVKKMLGV